MCGAEWKLGLTRRGGYEAIAQEAMILGAIVLKHDRVRKCPRWNRWATRCKALGSLGLWFTRCGSGGRLTPCELSYWTLQGSRFLEQKPRFEHAHNQDEPPGSDAAGTAGGSDV